MYPSVAGAPATAARHLRRLLRSARFLSPPGLTDLQSCREPSSQVHHGPAPRRDDGHPGQGRWMQQLNRVMRIARVKILIGPQLDDVGSTLLAR